MKLKLDTINKIIEIEEQVSLKDFLITLNQILPDDKWKEYTLRMSPTFTTWINPIHIPVGVPWNPNHQPFQPYYVDPVPGGNPTWQVTSAGTTDHGVYNLEVGTGN